ncbi:hypothetical protein INT48_000370 [Thamnidium elegans]|uniref:Uncharacterized protein n=1 Tax=Thamnidium elegans TaxID=101142 RepID=A0A8H7SS80_9FUNG|nr:hypothetical protein INT48_000370 [Thamnidium elegans]
MLDYIPNKTFIAKFWSYVFEEAFSNSELCLNWGDIMPTKAKKEQKIDMKIDLRILYCSNTKRYDISVGEFAKKSIRSKLYNNKLKHAAISKQVEDFYILEAVDTIAFPATHKSIKDNGIEKLMNCLEMAKPVPVAQEGHKRK